MVKGGFIPLPLVSCHTLFIPLPWFFFFFQFMALSITAICIIFVVMFICSWSVSLTELMNKILCEDKVLDWLTDGVAQYTYKQWPPFKKYLLKLLIESPSLISLLNIYIQSEQVFFFFNIVFCFFYSHESSNQLGNANHFHGIMELVSLRTLNFKGFYKEKPATSKWNLMQK